MTANRVFPGEDAKQKAEDYHGGCTYNRTLPDIKSKDIKSVNIEVAFEDAVKLNLAIQSCLLALNKNNRNTKVGRRMGVVLSIKTDNSSISVMEKKLGEEK
jgi:hypothetical protein